MAESGSTTWALGSLPLAPALWPLTHSRGASGFQTCPRHRSSSIIREQRCHRHGRFFGQGSWQRNRDKPGRNQRRDDNRIHTQRGAHTAFHMALDLSCECSGRNLWNLLVSETAEG